MSCWPTFISCRPKVNAPNFFNGYWAFQHTKGFGDKIKIKWPISKSKIRN